MDENIQALKNPVYKPCGGCGATEPGQRCIGCLHDFGSPTHGLDPYEDAEARRESRRVQELLEANNRYLERARAAEALLAEARDCLEAIAAREIEELNKPTPSVVLTYTNYRGETAERRIIPFEVWFGSTEWHPEPQWLLRAYDCEKKADRDFALKDFGKPAAVTTEECGWEYKTVETGRKSGTGHKDVWPDGDGWEIDLTRGRPGEGWERFDCHEELYFRRRAASTANGGPE